MADTTLARGERKKSHLNRKHNTKCNIVSCVGRTSSGFMCLQLNQFSSLSLPSLLDCGRFTSVCLSRLCCFVSASFPIIVLFSFSLRCAICTRFHFRVCAVAVPSENISMVHPSAGVQLRSINLFTSLSLIDPIRCKLPYRKDLLCK